MRKHRFYHADKLTIDTNCLLDEANSYQILKILRLKPEQEIWLFNNTPFDFKATIHKISKNKVFANIITQHPNHKCSPCNIHLGQAIAKGQKMDFIIQKAVELGVSAITPLISERTIVNIAKEKIPARMAHWQKIIINACCQCGHSILPTIHAPISLQEWIIKNPTITKLILNPDANLSITQVPANKNINILIGPEGGFSQDELTFANRHNCIDVRLGPRILRTETASIAAIAGLQLLFGDLN